MADIESGSAVSRALQLYDDRPFGVRLFVRARSMLCPMDTLELQVPKRGRILDLGCGHGLFSATLAVGSRERSILGVDPSSAKITTAKQLMNRLPNVKFFQGTADDVTESSLNAITILDVLYLLPVEEKLKTLSRCHKLLSAGGLLVLKTNDTHPIWKYRWTSFQELAMTRVGLTMGPGGLHFLGCRDTADLLRRAGFRDVEVVHLRSRLPYPHTLFLASP